MSRERRLSILLALFSVLFTCGAIEGFLRATVNMSAAATSVIHKDWAARYWTPINILGYRDVEPHSADLTNVLVIGDSFISGYGIEYIDDRISGVLQTKLGSEYGVNIAAQIAWETPREFEALQDYTVVPDVVVLSHFANDILWTLPNYPHVYPPQSALEYVSEQFYATTFLYRMYAPFRSDTLVSDQYQDADKVAQHLALLSEIIAYCEAHGIRLIFLLWDLPTENATVSMITPLLDSAGVEYVDTTTFLMGRPLSEIAASPMDGHPNESVHAEAAHLLAALIRQ